MSEYTIGVIGLGYIGSVMVAGLANHVKEIIIYDIDYEKLKAVDSKSYCFPEVEVANVISSAHLKIASSVEDLVASGCDLILICLPTPLINGKLSLGSVTETLQLLEELRYPGTVCIRSTMSLESTAINELENQNLDVCIVPEFLREGSALSDFRSAEVLVVGVSKQTTADSISRVKNILALYCKKVVFMSVQEAILTKLINNAWHATKVAFANEWHLLANSLENVNTDKIYEAFISDNKLNCSAAYLKPGGPFGGPCLIKDTTELVRLQSSDGLGVIQGSLKSNEKHMEILADKLIDTCIKRNVSFFKFDNYEFKKNTTDVRDSPVLIVQQIVLERSNLNVVTDQDDYINIKKAIVFSGQVLVNSGDIEIVEIR